MMVPLPAGESISNQSYILESYMNLCYSRVAAIAKCGLHNADFCDKLY